MIRVSAPADQQSAGLEWELLDLLLSDDLVVRVMFEDIVTAEWPPPPDAPVTDPAGVRGGPDGGWPRPSGSSAEIRQRGVRRPGVEGWARERSPPAHQVQPVQKI